MPLWRCMPDALQFRLRSDFSSERYLARRSPGEGLCSTTAFPCVGNVGWGKGRRQDAQGPPLIQKVAGRTCAYMHVAQQCASRQLVTTDHSHRSLSF